MLSFKVNTDPLVHVFIKFITYKKYNKHTLFAYWYILTKPTAAEYSLHTIFTFTKSALAPFANVSFVKQKVMSEIPKVFTVNLVHGKVHKQLSVKLLCLRLPLNMHFV